MNEKNDFANVDNFLNLQISNEEIQCRKIITQTTKLRKQRGMSLNQLAKTIDVAHTTIARIENFEMIPTLKMILQILSVFDMSLELVSKNKKSFEPITNDTIYSKEILLELNKKINLVISYTEDYSECIKSIFQNYCSCLQMYNVNVNTIHNVDSFGKDMILVLSAYYAGQHNIAYLWFKNSIEKNLDLNMFFVNMPEKHTLYRSRKKKDDRKYTNNELFHIPFNQRYKVSTQRYSFPGLPCLYLGNSKEVCSIELGCSENDLVTATINYVNNGEKYKILDLTAPFISKIINDTVLKNLPLVLICSIQIDYDKENSNFRKEYIFSQLLLEYIINESLLQNESILGIKYCSTKINFIQEWLNGKNKVIENMANYVFPARNIDSISGYCEILQNKFTISNIENN